MESVRHFRWRVLGALLFSLSLVAVPAFGAHSIAQSTHGVVSKTKVLPKGMYRNPETITWKGNSRVNNCGDPSIIYAKDKNWYAYCTTDYISNTDYRLHYLAIIKSHDLITWQYVGDVFQTIPSWLGGPAKFLWGPDIRYFNGKYYVYYAADNSSAGGPAIGVATSSKPSGPWTDSGGPVVEAHAPPCAPGCGADAKMATIDPDIITDNGQMYIFYGSYFGGVQARKLSADGLHSDPASQTQITIDNRYEGPYVFKHGNYFYLFVSANNCCNGPLTGYAVFVGRSQNVLGPYLDQQGQSLLSPQPGGTPVLVQNGNKWVGPGHNAVITDFKGQDWIVYHAFDRNHPYVSTGPPLYPGARQFMIDPLDWVNDWPITRGGYGPSDQLMPAPAAQPKTREVYAPNLVTVERLGAADATASDEFDGSTLGSQWSWVRQPAAGTFGLDSGAFSMDTQDAELYGTKNSASLLLQAAPSGNYAIEAKMSVTVPQDGSCCYNYVQAGIIAYKDDDNYVRLSDVSIFNTRQTELAKEMTPPSNPNIPFFGTTNIGPPGNPWTWLRIVRTTSGKDELYRGYTSTDGKTWVRGGVWTHQLGTSARVGIFAYGGKGFTAHFDYFHVYPVVG